MDSDYVYNGYSSNTPAIGSDGSIFVCGGGKVFAFHPDDGYIKWSYSGVNNRMACMSEISLELSGFFSWKYEFT